MTRLTPIPDDLDMLPFEEEIENGEYDEAFHQRQFEREEAAYFNRLENEHW